MSGPLADAYHSIKAALDIFKHSAAPTPDVPSKQALLKQADAIKTDAAKIGMMCSDGTPPADQLASLAGSLHQSCVALCNSCHMLTAAAGPTLKDSLVKLAQGVINPCLVLVKEMASGKDLKPQVAVVWDGVAAVNKAPLDNKACIFKALAAVMAVMKDTTRELGELQQEQQEQYGDAAESDRSMPAAARALAGSTSEQQSQAAAVILDATDVGSQPAAVIAAATSPRSSTAQTAAAAMAAAADHTSALDGTDFDDLDYQGGQMSSIERQLLSSSLALIAASTATLKVFGRALLQGTELILGTDTLDSWESCLFHSRHLRRAVEDLGAAMYPPQDFEEVASAALAVFEVTELMADECPDAEAVGAEQLSSLAAQLTAAHDKLQELLVVAQQQANNTEEQ